MWDWFRPPIPRVGFDDVLLALNQPDKYILINTLPLDQQHCLVEGTLPYHQEERVMNDLLGAYDMTSKTILVYGKHGVDSTAEKKCRQIQKLGFTEVYWYVGGLFEWILLQDIFGRDEFPTTTPPNRDILSYKPLSTLRLARIGYT
jgi:rhodanese-related sulfurtransferase